MDGMTIPILIAGVVALFGWGIFQVFGGALSSEKRKLKQRLEAKSTPDAQSNDARKSILLQVEATGAAAQLVRVKFFEKLNRKVIQAYPDTTLTKFLCICAGIGFVFGMIATAITVEPVFGLAAGAGGAYVPFFILGMKRNKRQKVLAEQLPEALEFLARILQAGHSLSTGMQTIAEEMPEPIAGEFRRCNDQHSLGQPIDDCMKDMAARIGSTDFAFFVTAVLIQRTTGGDLSEVLGNISGMIRQRIRLAQSVKAKTAEGRFTGYILVALPAILLVIAYMLNPQYASVLFKTTTGLQLLGVAVVLQVLGLFSIRKITTIKV